MGSGQSENSLSEWSFFYGGYWDLKEGGGVSHVCQAESSPSLSLQVWCSNSPHIVIPGENPRGRKEAFLLPLPSSVSPAQVNGLCIRAKNERAANGELRIENLALWFHHLLE